MSKAFAQLRIKDSKNILNFSKFTYVATFVTSKGRVATTSPQPIARDGLGGEVFVQLNKDEKPENTTVSFKIYLPSGTLYNGKHSIHGPTYTRDGTSPPITTIYNLKLFQERTQQKQNHRVQMRVIPTTHEIPGGLRMVAYLRNEIKKAATKYGVSSQIIASIVFEEKLHGRWAYRKNLAAYYRNLGALFPNNSYGFGEMQLGLAGDLMGVDKTNPIWIDEVFTIICTDATVAMELVAKNIVQGEKELGRKMDFQEATVFYNAGPKGLSSWLKGEITQATLDEAVYTRSWNWQKAIKLALNGDLISIPDDSTVYRADPEKALETWKFDPSLSLYL